MLAVKRGLPALSRASSSRAVIKTSRALSRRFYADDSNGKQANRNSAYSKILSAEDNAGKEAIDDVLSPGRGKAPDLPPRYGDGKLPPSNRGVKPAPLAAPTATATGTYQFPERTRQRVNREQSAFALEPEELDDAARKANEAFPGGEGGQSEGGFARETSAIVFTVPYRLHVLARSKNCIMTLCDENYRRVLVTSSGRNKFKNVAEGTYEAGYQCALRVFEALRIEKNKRKEGIKLHIFINGFGQGRSALLKALTMSEGDGIRQIVDKLSDTTPIKIGGVRLQKSRRL